MTTTTYPVLETKQFSYSKDYNIFSANVRDLPVNPIERGEFLMKSSKTGNEVIFFIVSSIYDLSERPIGARFLVSYDDVDRFPALENCLVDLYF